MILYWFYKALDKLYIFLSRTHEILVVKYNVLEVIAVVVVLVLFLKYNLFTYFTLDYSKVFFRLKHNREQTWGTQSWYELIQSWYALIQAFVEERRKEEILEKGYDYDTFDECYPNFGGDVDYYDTLPGPNDKQISLRGRRPAYARLVVLWLAVVPYICDYYNIKPMSYKTTFVWGSKERDWLFIVENAGAIAGQQVILANIDFSKPLVCSLGQKFYAQVLASSRNDPYISQHRLYFEGYPFFSKRATQMFFEAPWVITYLNGYGTAANVLEERVKYQYQPWCAYRPDAMNMLLDPIWVHLGNKRILDKRAFMCKFLELLPQVNPWYKHMSFHLAFLLYESIILEYYAKKYFTISKSSRQLIIKELVIHLKLKYGQSFIDETKMLPLLLLYSQRFMVQYLQRFRPKVSARD